MPKKTVKTTKKNKVTKKTTKTTKKAVKKPVAPVVAAPAPVAPPVQPVMPAPVKSEAEKMWTEIRNLPIQMFGLPAQTVAQHCTFVPVEPTRLYVTIRSTAALPSLEAAIAPFFTVELADKYVIIQRTPAPLVPGKR